MNRRCHITAGIASVLLAVISSIGCAKSDPASDPPSAKKVANSTSAAMMNPVPNSNATNLETITLGSGCFWCTEAMFQNLRGVKSFDPAVISLAEILRVFWRTHDPTTLNRQGHDVGTQYRSAVFYHNDEQREVAGQYKDQLDKSEAFGAPIVTEITKFEKFYPAEDYHQKYFDLNPNQGYCQMVIRPKVEKFNKEFAELLDK
jgi:peptide methionine sulfoxide reductase MsrA